jgi:hypothetical protein
MSTDNFEQGISDGFLRRLQHSHTLAEQWKDTECVLMAIDEMWLIGWWNARGGRHPVRLS